MKKTLCLILFIASIYLFCSCDAAHNQYRETSGNTITNEENSTMSEMKGILQGHWVLRETDYNYLVSFDFSNNTLLEGFYPGGGMSWEIQKISLKSQNVLSITVHYPGSDEIPAEDGVFSISFADEEKSEIAVQWNGNEAFYCKYAGRTQESLQQMCEETNTDNSPNYSDNTVSKCKYCQADAVDGSRYCKNHKCLVSSCNNETKRYSVSPYCGIHTCLVDGCTRKAEDGSYYCWTHE